MDTLTHIVLGACIGEAIAGKQLGKKALLLGALSQSLPDIDFTASFWLPTSCDLLVHRGFTHSFLFVALAAPLLAWCSGKLFPGAGVGFGRWLFFWGLQVFIHIFIDAFNAYGTGWFEPFSHLRISFNSMYVADPLFSIWPAAAFVALLVMRKTSLNRMHWAKTAIWISSAYLLLGVVFKLVTDYKVSSELQRQHIESTRHFTTPTPLNNLLWYIVSETDSGYYIGYRSVLDKQQHIDFHFAPKNDNLLKLAPDQADVARLVRFSDGFYTAQMWHDTLVFNDLRFGEILGWRQKQPKFAFYYYLQYPENNKVIVQRGRFAGWNKEVFLDFMSRIAGKQ